MYSMVQAGSMGVPFIAVRGLIGSDILAHRPDLRVVEDPFQAGEQVVVARPLRPDMAVFHALAADRFGNAILSGPRKDHVMMARAGRRVIVTTEEIVDGELDADKAGGRIFLQAIDVEQVVPAPFGAHPGSCGGRYDYDRDRIREYIEAAATEETFSAYLDKYVYGLAGHEAYLSLSGLSSLR